ncbi:MAG: alpha/beta hydrolase [Abitibacteriaceae bacterium]|nr:alpha/beta hydrolase [Abditibacteriaceae bacterium]
MSLSRRRLLIWLCLLLVPVSLGALRGSAQQNGAQVENDVSYGEAGGQKLLLDVYRPGGEAKTRPAVILVHGGGWSGGDKRDFEPYGRALARQGYVAFSVNYRLATKEGNKYPAQIDDVQRAVRWIRAHADTYGVDPNHIGALGASAGGHLVALLGTRDTRDNSDPALAKYSSRVQCVVDMFGPTDFTVQGPLSEQAMAILYNFIGKTPQEAPAVYREASPITYVDKNSAPFAIFHGTADPLVPIGQSQRLYDALQKAGVESSFTKFEGEGHGFQRPETNRQFALEALTFFNRHLKP